MDICMECETPYPFNKSLFCKTILMRSIDLCELLYYTNVVALKFFKLNSNVFSPLLGAQTFDGISTSIIFLFHKNTQLDIL
jgi:hypothetical protein